MLDLIMHRKVILKRIKRNLLGRQHRARNPTLANESDNIDYPTLAIGGFARATEPDQRPEWFPTLAIRAYPLQDLCRWNLGDGTPVIVRRARLQDESLMSDFQKSLSQETVHLRYFGCAKLEIRIRDDFRTRTCLGSRTLVVERLLPIGDGREIIGVAYLIKVDDVNQAEFAIVIADKWQRRGVGTKLLGALLEIGCTEGLDAIFGYILAENGAMRRICQKLGFAVRSNSSHDLSKLGSIYEIGYCLGAHGRSKCHFLEIWLTT
jgi:GNAT superfamily N-acetyltransferase